MRLRDVWPVYCVVYPKGFFRISFPFEDLLCPCLSLWCFHPASFFGMAWEVDSSQSRSVGCAARTRYIRIRRRIFPCVTRWRDVTRTWRGVITRRVRHDASFEHVTRWRLPISGAGGADRTVLNFEIGFRSIFEQINVIVGCFMENSCLFFTTSRKIIVLFSSYRCLDRYVKIKWIHHSLIFVSM